MPRLHLLAIEINATWHCNLSCLTGTHTGPVATSGLADPDTVERDLASLNEAVDIDVVRILGGEPLLHPKLSLLARAIRNSGLRATIRLSTNGTLLHATDFEWLEFVDEVQVSRHPGTRVRLEALAELTRLCHLAGKTLILKDFHSFRHAQPPVLLTPQETQAVFDTCQQAHAWSCHTVQGGHVYLCPVTADPGFADRDACPIEPTSTLADRLAEFLHRTIPPRACTMCLGTVGQRFTHQQPNAKTWLPLPRSGAIDLEQLEAVRRDPWANNGCSSDEILVDGLAEFFWVGWRHADQAA